MDRICSESGIDDSRICVQERSCCHRLCGVDRRVGGEWIRWLMMVDRKVQTGVVGGLLLKGELSEILGGD
jgi:hypothetical protein